ncbi:hypothetical protein [Mycolicibacterium fortuitum]|uniref:Uncharacterized protein n=1 Tax=Mycolicibacterium fortuitum TaxID=1766 RepID=A0ABD6QK50_MYCFO|nr:hypothetical protein [Mycolicibacterium fortuitum]NOP99835.1 hypothetical protein [Mycolicibacterium fortuitum]OMC40847.1 hypothetical protein A5742_31970 [Mycolicibacterium fortuitum]
MTSFLFDFLEDALPEGAARREIHELNEHNVLMLDLRGPSRGEMVNLIADRFLSWVATNAGDPDALSEGYGKLVELAKKQQLRSRMAASGQ